MIESEYRAIVDVIKIINIKQYPLKYAGIANLAERGFCRVEVILPKGVQPFSYVPCFIYVDTRDVLAVHVNNALPELVIEKYEGVIPDDLF